MESNSKVIAIFSDTITDKAIADIKSKHDGLVHDFTNEQEFKAARKVATEMNKVLKSIDRVGIDAAKQVTEVRNELKERVESAYSGTVEPFQIENQRRKDEAKRIADEKAARLAEQKQKLDMIKGAASRAMYLREDEITDILQDVMSIEIDSFDEDMRQEAQFAKDMSLSQLQEAYKHASEKEEARKAAELKEAELADKNDEIAALKAQLEALQPSKQKACDGKFKVRVEWSGYSHGYSIYEVEADSEDEAIENWCEGIKIESTTVRDDIEAQEAVIL